MKSLTFCKWEGQKKCRGAWKSFEIAYEFINIYVYLAQKKIREAKKCIGSVSCKQLKVEHAREYHFWSGLREECLLPEEAAFGQSQELKEKLGELRNTSLTVLVVVNVLWLTFMLTVMSQGKTLQVFGTDFASVGFLLIYFSVRINFDVSIIFDRDFLL